MSRKNNFENLASVAFNNQNLKLPDLKQQPSFIKYFGEVLREISVYFKSLAEGVLTMHCQQETGMKTVFYKLAEIQHLLEEQNLLKKDVLNFKEACEYLDVSASHLYHLTSGKKIPHSCPQGKKLYFNRKELDKWLQQNPQSTAKEIEAMADDYLMLNPKKQ